MMSVILIPTILILVIIGIAILFRYNGGGFIVPAYSRRPRRRHIIVRIICGVLGVLILAALGVGTLRNARGVYASAAEAEKINFHLPTKPSPELPKPKDLDEALPIKKARLLTHFIFISDNKPIHAEEMEIRLPEDSGRKFSKTGKIDAAHFEIGLKLHRLEVLKLRDGSHLSSPVSSYRVHFNSTLGSSSQGGWQDTIDMPEITDSPLPFGKTNPLVVIHYGQGRIQVVCLTQLVAFDDPLKTVSLNELVRGIDLSDRKLQPISRRQPSGSGAPAGFRLAESMGFSFALLVIATILLAQCFARRGLAFACMLALCVLYVAALDHAVLAIHVSKLEDKHLSVEARTFAAKSLPGTFFYRNSAKDAVDRAVKDETNPESLRELIRRTHY
jgi:hypothetical protein